MASRMNSGGSIDLNRIKIDPRTGEKFSFNLDIVAATAWYGQEAIRELSHGLTGEKFSFNVDIHVVAATFIHISQLILTRIQWPVQ